MMLAYIEGYRIIFKTNPFYENNIMPYLIARVHSPVGIFRGVVNIDGGLGMNVLRSETLYSSQRTMYPLLCSLTHMESRPSSPGLCSSRASLHSLLQTVPMEHFPIDSRIRNKYND